MTKAYSYCRFSSGEQAKGTSLERQREAQKLIAEKGWELDTTLQMDDLGISAYKKKNLDDVAALGQFIAKIKAGKIKKGSILVVEHLDRITRAEITVATQKFLEIVNGGITIVSMTPIYREYSKKGLDDNPYLMTELTMGFIAAREYAANIQRRLKKYWEIRRQHHKEKPIGGRIPCWLEFKDGKFQKIPEKVAIVTRILGMAIKDNYGSARITNILNTEGIPSISTHSKTKGNKWAAAGVAQLLKNEALYGSAFPATYEDDIRRETGEEWVNYYPPIITKEQYQRLQMQRINRAAGRNGVKASDTANLFSGLIKTISGHKWHKIKKNIPRIAPANFRDGTADQLSFPFEPLEKFLLNTLAVDISLSDIGTDVDTPLSIIETLKIELHGIENKIAKLQTAFKSNPDADALLQLIVSMNADKNKLLKAIETEERKVVSQPREELNEIKSMLKDSDKPEARGSLKLIISRLVREIRMNVVGTRRSPCKAAEIQIFFRAGGIVSCAITCEADRVLSTIKTRDFPAIVDFRCPSERLTAYLKLREDFYLATFQQYFDLRCGRVTFDKTGAGQIAKGKWQSIPVSEFIQGYTHLPKS